MSAPDIKTFTIQGGAEVFGHSRRGRKAKGDGSTSRKRGGGAPTLADVQREGEAKVLGRRRSAGFSKSNSEK